LGQGFNLSTYQEGALVNLDVSQLATALTRAGNKEAAIGELNFALRSLSDPLQRLSVAQQLHDLGAFRASQRTASLLLDTLSQDLRTWHLAYPQAYASEVFAEAQKHQLEPELVWAIMRQESAFYPNAVSTSNAKGLMQVIPSTWDWLAELQKETPGNPFDAATNIRYGSFYLNWLLNYFSDYNSDLELVIASYNRGQGYIRRLFESPDVNLNKDDLYRDIDALETREYLQKVSENYQIYKALYPRYTVTAN
jgi:soluble lytic murein transglycosylase